MKIMELLKQKSLLADGAFGTEIRALVKNIEEYKLIECVEVFNIIAPKLVQQIHEQYIRAGSDIIELNSFLCNPLWLKYMNIDFTAPQIIKAAVYNGKIIASQFKNKYIIGTVALLPTCAIVNRTDKEIRESYYIHISNLALHEVDSILIETSFNFKQLKLALEAAFTINEIRTRNLPVWVQVVLTTDLTMPCGTNLLEVLNLISNYNISLFGLNCIADLELANKAFRIIKSKTNLPLSFLPNAGTPIKIADEYEYTLDFEELANDIKKISNEHNIKINGGCCGTTPKFINTLYNVIHKQ